MTTTILLQFIKSGRVVNDRDTRRGRGGGEEGGGGGGKRRELGGAAVGPEGGERADGERRAARVARATQPRRSA